MTVAKSSDGRKCSYEAQVASAADYHPFGWEMPGRKYNSSEYRYGFNGMEKEVDILSGYGIYSAEYWKYDSRTGRRWNMDPITLPNISPYVAFQNNPIFYDDPKGDICPWCWGAVLGGVVELTAQIAVNYVIEGSFVKAVKKVDLYDVGVAVVEGGVTAGRSSASKLVRMATAATSELAKASIDVQVSGETKSVFTGTKSTQEFVQQAVVGFVTGEVIRFKDNRVSAKMAQLGVSSSKEISEESAKASVKAARAARGARTASSRVQGDKLKEASEALGVVEKLKNLQLDRAKTIGGVVENSSKAFEAAVETGADVITKAFEQIQNDALDKVRVDKFVTNDGNGTITVTRKRGEEEISKKVYQKNEDTGNYELNKRLSN